MCIDVNSYCIVGFGNHSKKKILPALQKLNKTIFGIVSSKTNLDINYQVFTTLEDAISKSGHNTKFIICSPPKQHFSQIKLILESNRSVYVEKPIFTNSKDANYLNNKLKGKDIFVVELLMYKYTRQYQKFLKLWNKTKEKVIKVECTFNIPSIPSNTFRDAYNVESSPLYDIGCYIISLLVDLKISLIRLKVTNTNGQNNKLLQFYIKGHSRGIEFCIEFGIGDEYKNSVKLKYVNNRSVEFNKFFYGLEGSKTIVFTNNKKLSHIIINDQNGFENLFEYPPLYWLDNQDMRIKNIIKVNNKLSLLKKELILSRRETI